VPHGTGAARQQPVGRTGDDLSAVAVAHEHDAVQFLGLHQAQHIGDMGLQLDVRAGADGRVRHRR
jgi:hypothetical protein